MQNAQIEIIARSLETVVNSKYSIQCCTRTQSLMNKGVIHKTFFELLLMSNYLDFSDTQICYTFTIDEGGKYMGSLKECSDTKSDLNQNTKSDTREAL